MSKQDKTDINTYWFQNIHLLLDINKSEQFYPKSGMTYAQKVNALVRGAIYLGIILSLINFSRAIKVFAHISIPPI